MILIITIKDDIHAISIQNSLKGKGYHNCHILECDQLSSTHRMHWYDGMIKNDAIIHLADGTQVDIDMVDLIWWRRVKADQELPKNINDDYQMKLINNDCRGALSGILEANFKGKWISNPSATDKASNKIYQLGCENAPVSSERVMPAISLGCMICGIRRPCTGSSPGTAPAPI